MTVGLFTKFFLEPTHVAIAQVLRGLVDVRYRVVAKGFQPLPSIDIPNATRAFDLTTGVCPPDALADCDIVHAIYDGHVAFDAFAVSDALKKPFILSFHGGFDTNAKIWKPRLRERTIDAANQAARVTVVSNTDARRMKELGVTRTVDVVPVPVDLSLVIAAAMPTENHLVAIGRLVPKKGFDTAIQCLRLLPENFRLTIIGSGPEEANLRSLALRESVTDRVVFAGSLSLEKMLTELATARVLLHPSRVAEDGNAESTPQVVLWSQALGVPVVVGASGSVADIVTDRVTGRLISNGRAREFAAAIEEMCADGPKRESIIATARAFVAQHHSLPAVLQRWRAIYHVTLNRKTDAGPSSHFEISLNEGRNPLYRAALSSARSQLGPGTKCVLLESGGQGTIYVADSPRYGRVALKVAHYRNENRRDATLTELRLRKEATALAELNRLGCLTVPRLHYADAHGRFLVRELIEGATLQDVVLGSGAQQRVHLLNNLWKTVNDLFRFFHGRAFGAYIIRDLKPKNLIVATTPQRRIVLVDVGSIKSVNDSAVSKRSHAKQRLGTRNWLHWAPEVLVQHGSGATLRSDYFSFAVTAYYTLLGQVPYTNSESDETLAMKAYYREHSFAYATWTTACLQHQIAPSLAQFVGDALHPKAAKRPAAMVYYA